MSILTVTLNSCVDKTYTVPGFALDQVHRPTQTLITAGGKGINVARVYRKFGGTAVATGFLGGANGVWLHQAMLAEGITSKFVTVAEESRTCIAIMDPLNATQTELNENGPRVTEADTETLRNLLRELLSGCTAVVISGSMPPGMSASFYQDVVTLAQDEADVPVVLDTSGDALALGAQARPWLLKPNAHEARALGIAVNTSGLEGLGDAAQAVRARYNVPLAMVTGGALGAVLASKEGLWEAVPPPIRVASAVGSGDSLASAFLWAMHNGYTMGDALRLGVAAGAANAMTYGAGLFPPDLAFDLFARTSLSKRA